MKDTLDALSDAIFNGPATIAFWRDKPKRVIKCSSRNCGNSYIFQMDIEKYYPNMPHEIANRLFKNIWRRN